MKDGIYAVKHANWGKHKMPIHRFVKEASKIQRPGILWMRWTPTTQIIILVMMHYISCPVCWLYITGNDPIAGSRENQLMLDAVNQLRRRLLLWQAIYAGSTTIKVEWHALYECHEPCYGNARFEFCPLFQRWKKHWSVWWFWIPMAICRWKSGWRSNVFWWYWVTGSDSKSHCRMLMNPNMKENGCCPI